MTLSSSSDVWLAPPPDLELLADEVHLWRIALDPPGEVVERLVPILAADERERAARFRAPLHRTRYLVGRALLRMIMGRYLAQEPARLAFIYGLHGKPALSGEVRASDLRFNLANSQDLALLAVARGRDVGVDLEALRPLVDAERIVARFFSAREQADFLRVAPALRQETFFRGWVRKEAYIKAIGMGLSLPLGDFDVTLAPGDPPRLLRVANQPDEPDRWTLAEIRPDPGFLGAIAVEGRGWRLRHFTGTPEELSPATFST